MHQGQRNYPKFQIHEKTTSEVVCRSVKLSGTPKRDQSLFSLLLGIESRLRKEGRNDQIEQRKRSKEKDRQRSSVKNLSRYCEKLSLSGPQPQVVVSAWIAPSAPESAFVSPALMLPLFGSKAARTGSNPCSGLERRGTSLRTSGFNRT